MKFKVIQEKFNIHAYVLSHMLNRQTPKPSCQTNVFIHIKYQTFKFSKFRNFLIYIYYSSGTIILNAYFMPFTLPDILVQIYFLTGK